MYVPDQTREQAAREGEDVRKGRVVDVRAGRHRDDAGESAGQRPERVAAAGEPAAREAAGEADRDRERDRAERRRGQVDVEPAREDRRLDHQAGGVEAVEPGEDEHQAHQGHVRVVRSEGARPALHVELADAWPEVEQNAEGERTGDAVDDERGDRVVEAELRDEPAAGAPAPGRVRDPDRRAEQDGQEQVGGQPDPLDDGAGHDRAGRPREEEERQEEDGADVILEVRAPSPPTRALLPRRSREIARGRRGRPVSPARPSGSPAGSSRRCTSRSSRTSA